MRGLRGILGALAAVAAAAALTGCTDASSPGEVPTSTPPAGHRCFDRPGGITDLGDGGWRSPSGRRWTTADGCWVSNDVVADVDGPEHCGWRSMRLLAVTEPIGRRRTPDNSRTYVRDPENVLHDIVTAGRLDVDAVLPAIAMFTGLRSGRMELWAIPGDPGWIYLRGAETVERWPLDRDVPACA